MHEMALVKSMIDILNREVDDPEVGDVKSVHLEVGALRYIVPEIMDSAFNSISRDDKLRSARLEMKILPVKFRCGGCGNVSEGIDQGGSCGKCGCDRVNMISGDEFRIMGIEW